MSILKPDKLKKIVMGGAAISAVSLAVLKTTAVLTKDHEYDEENSKCTSSRQAKGNIYSRYIKRGLDTVLSFGALIVLSPVFLICSLLIFIDDPGPILFTQKRVGINKTHFKLHKFRSMKMSTPHDTPTHLLDNPEQYITRMGSRLSTKEQKKIETKW